MFRGIDASDSTEELVFTRQVEKEENLQVYRHSWQVYRHSWQVYRHSWQVYSHSWQVAVFIVQQLCKAQKRNDKSPVHVQQLPVSTFHQDLLIHYVGDVGSLTYIRPFMASWLVDCSHYRIY